MPLDPRRRAEPCDFPRDEAWRVSCSAGPGMKTALILALLAVAAGAVACVPPDDGDSVISVHELEPNDTSATATQMGAGGFYTFFGLCDEGEAADWFTVTSKAGRVYGDLYATTHIPGVSDFAPSQVRVSMFGASMEKLDEAVVEGETTRNFAADVSAGPVLLELACPGDVMWFQGTLHVP